MILFECSCGKAMLFDSIENITHVVCASCGSCNSLNSYNQSCKGQFPDIEELYSQIEKCCDQGKIDKEIISLSNRFNLDPIILVELANIHLGRAKKKQNVDFHVCQEFCKITVSQVELDSVINSQLNLAQKVDDLQKKKFIKPIQRRNMEVERLNDLLKVEKEKDEDLTKMLADKAKEVEVLKNKLSKYEGI